MKFFLFLLSLILLSFSLYANEEKFKIGIFQKKLFATRKEAKIGAELWLKHMREKDEEFKMDMIFYEDEKKIIKDYISGKISVVLFDATSYYKNKKTIDQLTDHKWIMSSSKGIFDKFYLIKNKKLKFELDDLKNKHIFYNDEMAKVWLDSLLYKNKRKKIDKKYIKTEKENKLIFNVFFNKDDLSIISQDAYISMLELNPQIKQRIEIVSESEAIFFNAIGFSRKNLSSKFENMIDLMRTKLVKKEKGFDVLSLVDIQKIYVLKENDLNKLDEFYKEYFFLKKKYRK